MGPRPDRVYQDKPFQSTRQSMYKFLYVSNARRGATRAICTQDRPSGDTCSDVDRLCRVAAPVISLDGDLLPGKRLVFWYENGCTQSDKKKKSCIFQSIFPLFFFPKKRVVSVSVRARIIRSNNRGEGGGRVQLCGYLYNHPGRCCLCLRTLDSVSSHTQRQGSSRGDKRAPTPIPSQTSLLPKAHTGRIPIGAKQRRERGLAGTIKESK